MELSVLHEAVTAAQWLREHPADSLMRFVIAAGINHDSDQWCARATRRLLASNGSSIVRYAYFYPRAAPASLELPVDKDPADILANGCTLGAVWVESPQSDSASGNLLADRTRAELLKVYGRVTAGSDSFGGRPITDARRKLLMGLPGYEARRLGISFFGSAGWQTPGRWQRGPVTAVSAFDLGLDRPRRPRMPAFAYLPQSELGGRWNADTLVMSNPETDSALEIAGSATRLDPGLVSQVLSLKNREAPDSERLALVTAWLAAAKNLSPDRRAAALFVADAMVPEEMSREDSANRAAYINLGSEYIYSEIDGVYNYTHGLLKESLSLDPNGPIGQLTTIEMLDRGYNLNGMCDGGFEDVIKSGESLLERLKDPVSRAHVMFILADAYADVVALAAGQGGEYVDTTKFTPRAASARQKAVAYYQKALALNPKSSRARGAWLEAWRLLAGLPPGRTHYFCVYD